MSHMDDREHGSPDYFYFRNYDTNGHFSESDGTILGWIAVIFGVIFILAALFH